jgi:hypothetical protein
MEYVWILIWDGAYPTDGYQILGVFKERIEAEKEVPDEYTVLERNEDTTYYKKGEKFYSETMRIKRNVIQP